MKTEEPGRQTSSIRVRKLADHGNETDLDNATPAQRLGMMWQLALDAWSFKGDSVAQSRLPRHIIRIVRGEG